MNAHKPLQWVKIYTGLVEPISDDAMFAQNVSIPRRHQTWCPTKGWEARKGWLGGLPKSIGLTNLWVCIAFHSSPRNRSSKEFQSTFEELSSTREFQLRHRRNSSKSWNHCPKWWLGNSDLTVEENCQNCLIEECIFSGSWVLIHLNET